MQQHIKPSLNRPPAQLNLCRLHSWCLLHESSSLCPTSAYFLISLSLLLSLSVWPTPVFLSIIPSPFGPAALLFLPCHICHGCSVAAVALGFKFNLVSICCNCFERRPCRHVFPLLCLLEYSIGCTWKCASVCMWIRLKVHVCETWTIDWPHTVSDTLCQTPFFCLKAPWQFDNDFVGLRHRVLCLRRSKDWRREQTKYARHRIFLWHHITT